jgi:streptomycin 6-kinase
MATGDAFADRIVKMHGNDGKVWLDSIAATLQICESRWGVKFSEPFTLNYNFVAPSVDGRLIVKICLSPADFQSEYSTLYHYRGRGLCNLLDVIEERHVLLLEALHPGDNIISLDEDSAIKVTCSIIKQLREAKPEVLNVFPTISDWTAGLTALRSQVGKNYGLINNAVLDSVEHILRRLASTQRSVYVLHGDLHHENILSHGDHWKAIDPKGVRGETEFEIVPFLLNNVPIEAVGPITEYRIEKFSAMLDLKADRIYGWGLVRAALAAWWNIEDKFGVSEQDLRFIDFFHEKTKSAFV